MKRTTRRAAKWLISAGLAAVLGATGACRDSSNQADALMASAVNGASAQPQPVQTTGTPGSPEATTTISGQQLPPPDPKFGGVIKEDALQSKAWWAPRVVPPKRPPTSC